MTPAHKRRVWKAIAVIGMLNFMAFLVTSVLMGDALNGQISDGHYYLFNKFHRPTYVEVSRNVYMYSWWHGVSAFASILLVLLSAAMLSDRPPTIAGLTGDLKDLPRAFTPIRLGLFASSLSAVASSHWKDVVPFWFAPTYFIVMGRLGGLVFGQLLTGTVLVPFPIAWAFLRAGRLISRGDLSFGQALIWVFLMPFLVLLALIPLLKPVLTRGTG